MLTLALNYNLVYKRDKDPLYKWHLPIKIYKFSLGSQ